MDITKEIEIVLRDANYATWQWTDGPVPVVCFENDEVIGFVHVFGLVSELLSDWEKSQDATLSRFRPALKNAGEKAWNVYSIFLAEDKHDESLQLRLDHIEENFRLTRKIARDGIGTKEGVISALLPLLPVRYRPQIDESNFHSRLLDRLSDISPDGATALLKGASAVDIAQILAEKQ